ncbi:YigZ family protein [Fodinibius sp.]|uniref:IMPACT family protein n=1 Tax=Fodinibius sp. TaxID=1872440 RepID=UPI002ACD6301|nr:YigZ family protein [Fodinibius sp.]MDZ7657874.1 YigZ family protein [Fodinibius sp.]
MYTISQTTQHSFREKGSKFIGYLFPVSSKEEFEDQLDNIKSKYPDATHHCYAWRINPTNTKEFSTDDGEPSGTAGQPILNKLKSYEVVNCGCVVVRYYGGTNLGTSGLIQAYGRSAEGCLEQAERSTIIPTKNVEITYPYNQQKEIDQLKNRFDLKEIEAQYLERVTIKIACRSDQAESFLNALKNLEHAGVSTEHLGSGYVTMSTN